MVLAGGIRVPPGTCSSSIMKMNLFYSNLHDVLFSYIIVSVGKLK